MLRIADQTPRHSLLQRLQRIGQRILSWLAEQEVNMLRHDSYP
jgi:IS1 family transposase